MRRRKTVQAHVLAMAAISVLAAGLAARATADQQVTINLAGVKFQNGLNQSRDSSPNTLSPAYEYGYHIEAMVKGDSGVLKTLYPNPTDLRDVLEALAPGSSSQLDGRTYNARHTHPFEVLNQPYSGSTTLLGIPVTFGVTMSAGINAGNLAFFSMTNVVISPAILIGSMTVTSGTVTITGTDGRVGDMDFDGTVNMFDIQGFIEALGTPITYEGDFGHDARLAGDVNRDGTMNIFDIDPFVALLTH